MHGRNSLEIWNQNEHQIHYTILSQLVYLILKTGLQREAGSNATLILELATQTLWCSWQQAQHFCSTLSNLSNIYGILAKSSSSFPYKNWISESLTGLAKAPIILPLFVIQTLRESLIGNLSFFAKIDTYHSLWSRLYPNHSNGSVCKNRWYPPLFAIQTLKSLHHFCGNNIFVIQTLVPFAKEVITWHSSRNRWWGWRWRSTLPGSKSLDKHALCTKGGPRLCCDKRIKSNHGMATSKCQIHWQL